MVPRSTVPPSARNKDFQSRACSDRQFQASGSISRLQPLTTKEKLMFTMRFISRAAGASLAAIALLSAQQLLAQSSSETARLEKLERAVELLQKQNAELKAEVKSLKSKDTAYVSDAKFKTKVTY